MKDTSGVCSLEQKIRIKEVNKHSNNRKFVFGFMTTGDFLSTITGIKTPILNLAGSLLGTIIGVILKVAGFIYSSKMAVGLLLTVMFVDWITGCYKAYKLGKFNSFTFQRMLVNITFTSIIVCLAYQISLVMPLISWIMLPEFLIGGFMVTNFYSIFENLHQADSKLISHKMFKHITWLLDLDRIVPAYFKPKTPDHLKDEVEKEIIEDVKPDEEVKTE